MIKKSGIRSPLIGSRHRQLQMWRHVLWGKALLSTGAYCTRCTHVSTLSGNCNCPSKQLGHRPNVEPSPLNSRKTSYLAKPQLSAQPIDELCTWHPPILVLTLPIITLQNRWDPAASGVFSHTFRGHSLYGIPLRDSIDTLLTSRGLRVWLHTLYREELICSLYPDQCGTLFPPFYLPIQIHPENLLFSSLLITST